jgi:transcription elongation factor GreA
MDKKQFYVTQKGLEELKSELENLQKKKRAEVVERVASARSMGDLSENSEYHAAKEELSLVDGRIEELEDIIKKVQIIKEDKKGSKVIQLGSQVTIKVSGKEEVFSLVGEWEADPHEKKISHESPLGKALIGRKPGDKVEVEAPAGKITYNILKIH